MPWPPIIGPSRNDSFSRDIGFPLAFFSRTSLHGHSQAQCFSHLRVYSPEQWPDPNTLYISSLIHSPFERSNFVHFSLSNRQVSPHVISCCRIALTLLIVGILCPCHPGYRTSTSAIPCAWPSPTCLGLMAILHSFYQCLVASSLPEICIPPLIYPTSCLPLLNRNWPNSYEHQLL